MKNFLHSEEQYRWLIKNYPLRERVIFRLLRVVLFVAYYDGKLIGIGVRTE